MLLAQNLKNRSQRMVEFTNVAFLFPFIGTHLSNQNYDVCIRRGLDRCVICYSAEISLEAGIAAGSFGLR